VNPKSAATQWLFAGRRRLGVYYAAAARDFPTVNLLAQKIGNDWDYTIWNDKSYVDSVLAWARQ